jgi:hypothetical protein
VTTAEYQELESRIKKNDLEALLCRWEVGKQLNAERGDAGRLPNGRLEELSNALDVSRSELNNRMRFARTYESEADVQEVLRNHGSWYAICRDLLKARLTDDEKHTPYTPELESRELFKAAAKLEDASDKLLRPGSQQDYQLEDILADRRYVDRHTVSGLRRSFIETRKRLTVAIEALTQRLEVRMDENLTSVTGPNLLTAIHGGDEGSSVAVVGRAASLPG